MSSVYMKWDFEDDYFIAVGWCLYNIKLHYKPTDPYSVS